MNEAQEEVLSLVRLLVTSLVDDEGAVRADIASDSDDDITTIEVNVAPDDVGKVIGRQGRTIKAIRTLARAAASADGLRVDVEVLG